MRILLLSWLFFIPLYLIIFFFSIHSSSAVSSQCHNDQRSLLLEMKNSLIFNTSLSTKLVKWDESVDCCSCDGVTCNDVGYVIGLDLSRESITGGIHNSTSLFGLQCIQNLNLAYNSFNYYAEIPPEFGKLTSLSYLNLSYSEFVGQIPIEISNLTRLVTLDLSFDFFEIPLQLKMLVHNLTELRELHLDGVKISGQGNEWCHALSSSLPNLQVLSLSSCYISGPINSSLLKLQSLSVLDLSFNKLDGPVPEFIANFTKLTSLSLTSSELHGIFPKRIFQVTTLQTLDLSYNSLLEGSLPEFPQASSLQNLVLSDTNFSGKLPDSIGSLKKLSRLQLWGCNFSGSIPNSFANLTQLVHFDLSNNNFTGSIPNSFANLTQLVHFDLSNNKFTGPIPNSLADLTRLDHLDLSANRFTGPIPSLCRLKNLTEIYMTNNDLTGLIPSPCFEGFTRLVKLDLRENSLNGKIPLSLFASPSLRYIDLSFNQFSFQFDEFPIPSSSVLKVLYLRNNNLEGPIPMSIFELRSIEWLDLSSNNFNGTIELSAFQKFENLSILNLSHNNLSVDVSVGNSTLPSFSPQISVLQMASCNLKVFPNLRNLSRLKELDLSNNQIRGKIPNWISTVGGGFLDLLNLSSNFLVGLEQPFPNLFTSVMLLDLHSNMLQGQIPILARRVDFLDYSINNLTSLIPGDIGNFLYCTVFFSLSGNKLTGNIPESICKVQFLKILDISHNVLNGSIPPCLLYNLTSTLGVLNLGKNYLHGSIPGTFSNECTLRTLDLSGNMLEGQVPKALANCKMLEVLNLGDNKINDNFPCWLRNSSDLRVLVLRFNQFQGPIICPNTNLSWSLLQILDLASNNLSGNLPSEYFLSWNSMIVDKDGSQPKLDYLHFEFILRRSANYYQDTVMVTIKGIQRELVKILTIFTTIDVSSNMFQGQIPEEVGHLKLLHGLNISHNALTGHIPSSMGNLKQLESLDLSRNKLNGVIPKQLVGLTFLSVLNLSFNQLEGMIPRGNQFQTFSDASFQGNKALCGTPLKATCMDEGVVESLLPTFEDKHSSKISWEYISAEIGFVFGLGVVIGPPLFWKRWRKWYCKRVDRIVLMILSCQDQGGGNRGRRARRGVRC